MKRQLFHTVADNMAGCLLQSPPDVFFISISILINRQVGTAEPRGADVLPGPALDRCKQIQRCTLHKVRRLGVAALLELAHDFPIIVAWSLHQRLTVRTEGATVACRAIRVMSG